MKLSVKREQWSFEREDCTLEGTLWKPEIQNGSAVVLLHGFAGNRYDLSKYARRLAEEGYLCIAYDARGHGRTGGQFRTQPMVDDLSAVVESLYFEHGMKAAGTIGHSMGGWISTMAAADCPGIGAVALLSGAVDPLNDFWRTPLPIQPFIRMGYKFIEHMEERDKDVAMPVKLIALIGGLRESLSGNKETAKHPRLMESSLLNIFKEFRDPPDAKEYAPRIDIPFLSYHGTKDELVPVDAAQALYEAAGCDAKELVVVEKGNHNMYHSHYKDIAPRILEFFDKWL